MSNKPLINDRFLLATESAQKLYRDYARDMPIIDYHCHLQPQEIAEDQRWENITQAWLGGDHYKWRLMRALGIDEFYITGDATDREKFDKFAKAMPRMLRNPIYHWSHMELARFFGIDDLLLSEDTADEVWERTAEALRQPEFSARGLMKKSLVEAVCTTDDPTDSLEWHSALQNDNSFDIKVLPTWRPDKGLDTSDVKAWNSWVAKLEKAADMDVDNFDSFMNALQKRHNYFSSMGCRLSDYGLGAVFCDECSESEASAIFDKVRDGAEPSTEEVRKIKSFMLIACGKMDAESDWTWQIHYNALRNNNSRMFKMLGPDTGFDSMGDWLVAEPLSRLFDSLESADKLPRTIVYSLNPRDNEVLATMLGNFQSGPTAGKMQLGSGWWFNDQIDGMKRQMETLSQMGLLSTFVGMLTDSRSFLSYTRHEYFRRILCDILGTEMEQGLLPRDFELVGELVSGVCYNNAAEYFKL
ncbi:MAG: glucuronate isomerase [Lentisphaerae bacterium]|nr:glucuronate isomerase [Lentisphaerota bacterium]